MIKALLLTMVLGTGYFQRVRDGNAVHEVYRSRHDVVLGSYVQRVKREWFQVQCVNGERSVVPTEGAARRVVEACPEP